MEISAGLGLRGPVMGHWILGEKRAIRYEFTAFYIGAGDRVIFILGDGMSLCDIGLQGCLLC